MSQEQDQDQVPAELPIIDITHDIDPSDALFAGDAQFLADTQHRKVEMHDFMTAMGIKTMRTQLTNSSGTTYKLMIQSV